MFSVIWLPNESKSVLFSVIWLQQLYRWTTIIESWHLASSNLRQCYRVLMCVYNGSCWWIFSAFNLVNTCPPSFKVEPKITRDSNLRDFAPQIYGTLRLKLTGPCASNLRDFAPQTYGTLRLKLTGPCASNLRDFAPQTYRFCLMPLSTV